MDSGYYTAMTGLVARTQALDTAAANLANAQTPGYRAEREFFRSALLGPDALDSELGHTRDQVEIEAVGDVVAHGDREHPIVDEGAYGVLEQTLLAGEPEIHGPGY